MGITWFEDTNRAKDTACKIWVRADSLEFVLGRFRSAASTPPITTIEKKELSTKNFFVQCTKH
ncbi:hypothetical protein DSM3645_28022 [Blastopirellula marina DSM 3645]|uniref:Uncharacterized protein n=1 Tax=Blastopirellula marina DSM 3645 TaxID=314230 RepID=A3ZP30_9BACT|nr:hypothetical protein DSM3645_28022 [Blastopirellula marina DSM 3645]